MTTSVSVTTELSVTTFVLVTDCVTVVGTQSIATHPLQITNKLTQENPFIATRALTSASMKRLNNFDLLECPVVETTAIESPTGRGVLGRSKVYGLMVLILPPFQLPQFLAEFPMGSNRGFLQACE